MTSNPLPSELRENIKQIRSNNRSLGSVLESAAIDEIMQLFEQEYQRRIKAAKSDREEAAQEELVEFATDVLNQFGYNGKSGGLSTLEWAESIIKKAELSSKEKEKE